MLRNKLSVPFPVVIIFFFHSLEDETIIGFSFIDIQNNQGLSKGYQPQPLADNPYFDFAYSGYRKNLIQ